MTKGSSFALKPRKFHAFQIVFNSGGKNSATPSPGDMNLWYVSPALGRPLLLSIHHQVHHLRILDFLCKMTLTSMSLRIRHQWQTISNSSLSERSAEVFVEVS